MKFIPHHKSKPPLRWIVNYGSGKFGLFFLMKGLRVYFKYEEDYDFDENFMPPKFDHYKIKFYFYLYDTISKPYNKWGTFYSLERDE